MNDPSFSGRLIQPHTSRWFVLLFGLPMSYAIVRYHIVGGVDWNHFLLFIAMSYLIGKTIKVYRSDSSKGLILIEFCGMVGVFTCDDPCVHVAAALRS